MLEPAEAEPRLGGAQNDFDVVEPQPGMWGNRDEDAVGIRQAPSIAAVAARIGERVVPGEIRELLRASAPIEVGRGGAEHHTFRHQPPGTQGAVVAERAEAQPEVEAVGDQIDDPVAEIQVEFQLRMRLGVVEQDRRRAAPAEENRHRDPQSPRHLLAA